MKWQPQKPNTKPIFILPKNLNIKPNCNKAVHMIIDKIPRKYKEIWDINTKYRFGIGIFLVYQTLGYRLTSLVTMFPVTGQEQKGERLADMCRGYRRSNMQTHTAAALEPTDRE